MERVRQLTRKIIRNASTKTINLKQIIFAMALPASTVADTLSVPSMVEENSFLTREIITETVIEAPLNLVWQTLVDFPAYATWNPFMISVVGEAIQGELLDVVIEPTAGDTIAFSSELVVVEANKELRWEGQLLMPGIFDGEHAFILESISATQVKFIQREKFYGLLVPVMWSKLDRDTRNGFTQMNAALKAKVESEPTTLP